MDVTEVEYNVPASQSEQQSFLTSCVFTVHFWVLDKIMFHTAFQVEIPKISNCNKYIHSMSQ